ncbi:MAG: hypothetical protein R2693_09755 [Nocardioidaceae bacterium]
MVTRELATDLARLPRCRAWSTDDINALAALLVEQALSAATALLPGTADPALP